MNSHEGMPWLRPGLSQPGKQTLAAALAALMLAPAFVDAKDTPSNLGGGLEQLAAPVARANAAVSSARIAASAEPEVALSHPVQLDDAGRALVRISLDGKVPGATVLQSLRAIAGVEISASDMSRIAGSGSATATLKGRQLTISGTFEGMRSAATIARIHRGPKGIRGPAILDLTVSKSHSGTLSGSLELTPEHVTDLVNGRLYIQIHSERAPDGNLWGWLLP